MDRAIEALKICGQKLADRDVARARLIATEACRSGRERRRVRRPGARARPGSCSRSSRARPRRGSRSPAAPRWSTRTPAASSSSTSAAARPNSSGSISPRPQTAGGGGCPTASATWMSLPVGVVSLSERHGGARCRRRELFEAMVAEVAAMLDAFPSVEALDAAVAAGDDPHARHLGHGDDARRRPSRPAALRPPPGRRHLADRRRRSRDLVDAVRGMDYEARVRQSLHRPRAGRPRARRLRHPRGDPPPLALRPPARRRPRPPRGHARRADGRGRRLAAARPAGAADDAHG